MEASAPDSAINIWLSSQVKLCALRFRKPPFAIQERVGGQTELDWSCPISRGPWEFLTLGWSTQVRKMYTSRVTKSLAWWMLLVGLAPGAFFHYDGAVRGVETFSLTKQVSRQAVCSVPWNESGKTKQRPSLFLLIVTLWNELEVKPGK